MESSEYSARLWSLRIWVSSLDAFTGMISLPNTNLGRSVLTLPSIAEMAGGWGYVSDRREQGLITYALTDTGIT